MGKKKKEKLPLKYYWENLTYGAAKATRSSLGLFVCTTMVAVGGTSNHRHLRKNIDIAVAEAKTADVPVFDVDAGSNNAGVQNKVLNIKLDDLIKHKTEMTKKLQEAPTKMDVRDLEPYIAEIRQEYDQKVENVLTEILTDTDISELDFKKMQTHIVEHNLVAEMTNANGRLFDINLRGTNALSLRECQTEKRDAYDVEHCMHELSNPGSPEHLSSVEMRVMNDNAPSILLGISFMLLTVLSGIELSGRRLSQGRPEKRKFIKPKGN